METTEWKQMTTGDEGAFLSIYKSYYRTLLTYGFSLTANLEIAKDCVQEMFLELWKKHAVVNKDVRDVRSYLFTWLRRKIAKELARSNKESNRSRDMEQPEQVWSYEQLLIAFQQTEEEKSKLRKALKQLTKRQLEIIELKYYQNLTYTEIAARTSLTPRTVYNMIYEAIRHLRECMHVITLSL